MITTEVAPHGTHQHPQAVSSELLPLHTPHAAVNLNTQAEGVARGELAGTAKNFIPLFRVLQTGLK